MSLFAWLHIMPLCILSIVLIVIQSVTSTTNPNLPPVNTSQEPEAELTIGFLGAYGHAKVVLGALPLAVDHVNTNYPIPKHKLRYKAVDVGATGSESLAQAQTSRAAVASMTEMRDQGAAAFIGPDDTCYSEALIAAAWNLPLISYNCADTRVSDKRAFPTFARTLPPSNKISIFVVALLQDFNWNNFVLVVGRSPVWVQLKDAVTELSIQQRLNIIGTYQVPDYIPKDIEQMEKIVTQTFERTRGEHIALVDLVKCLQQRSLLETGEYIIISVDDQIYDPDNRLSIVQREYLDPFLRMSENKMNNTFWGEDLPLSYRDIFGFRSVLKITPSFPSGPKYELFCESIRNRSAEPPFLVPYHATITNSLKVPIHAAHLYDAIIIYAKALKEVIDAGKDPKDGIAILERIKNSTYQSIQGYEVCIDENGDATGNFTVVSLLDDDDMNGTLQMSMQPVGYFKYQPNKIRSGDSKKLLPNFTYFDKNRPIKWVGGVQPQDQPKCGFQGELCAYPSKWRVIVPLVAIVAFVLLVAVIFAIRHYRYEQKLACVLWKVDMRDVTNIPTQKLGSQGRNGTMQMCRQRMFHTSLVDGEEVAQGPRHAFTRVGLYRGNVVAIKRVHKRSLDLTRSIRTELKQMREVRHDNLLPFVGACVDHGNICILTSYCARGSLEDVLANKDLHLDVFFISSLVTDFLKGLVYLHDSEIVSHGNLTSTNCLVDSRWVLQIADFGLHEFKGGQEQLDRAKIERRLLYRAPELLRDANAPARGTQKGDVYSFGIILYEVVGREGPWGDTPLSNQEIIEKVAAGITVDSTDGEASTSSPQQVFRPPTKDLGIASYILHCIQYCWDEDPDLRPDVRFVRLKLKEMQNGLKTNIFDNMLSIMDKYAYNLEGLVQERTELLTQEKKKTDALLYRMLPKTVAETLKGGRPVEAESFDCVTIYFSDIVGFTELSANSTPMEVVELLNELYTICDSVISHYDVYKVETIGDAYMVASGLPVRNGDRHASEVAAMAIHMLVRIRQFKIPHKPGELLKLRIGIHSGQCVAGVVGKTMPRYCLFGDTVNTASRMESTGEPFKIHISDVTYRLLKKIGGFQCERRGLTYIKGKGEMLTYWLKRKSQRSSHSDPRDPSERADFLETDIKYGEYNVEYINESSKLPSGTKKPYLETDIDAVCWCPVQNSSTTDDMLNPTQFSQYQANENDETLSTLVNSTTMLDIRGDMISITIENDVVQSPTSSSVSITIEDCQEEIFSTMV